MPHRLVCVAILVAWVAAAGALIRRDLLPDWMVGPPPDLRTVARAEEAAGPTRWSIQVADDPNRPEDRRTVGTVRTEATRKKDGFSLISSVATIEAGGLPRGTPVTSKEAALEVVSAFDIDPAGNLFHFHAAVRPAEVHDDLLTLEGTLKENAIEVHSRSRLLPILNGQWAFPYRARGMVQNTLSPSGSMPGLHVGQRWESQVVSPLTGQVGVARVEVVGTEPIYWNGAPVQALVVVSRVPSLSARTWVRPDGLVLRQELPLPFGRGTLYLERVLGEGTEPAP